MKAEDLIPIEQLCVNYNIEFTFIDSLNEIGLVEIVTLDENRFIEKENVNEIEKMIRLHYDLGINLEGLDAVSHLLKRMSELEREIKELRNKIDHY